MSEDIQKTPEVTLLKSELEAAAARVAERAGNLAVDSIGNLVGDVFGGLIGDRVKQWRNRNLVTSLAKTKEHLDHLGIPIDKAKVLPTGELYAIFDGMSKQDDPQLTDMWAALLANAMNPERNFVLDPSLPKVLEQLSGADAVILKFYHDAGAIKEPSPKNRNTTIDPTKTDTLENYRHFIQDEGDRILRLFGQEIASSSIGNLIRLGLLFVETSFDEHSTLVSVSVNRRSEFVVEDGELRDQLSHIYYRLNLASDNVEQHHLTHFTNYGGKERYFLPYDMTRLASRLIQACSP